jgi:hypothetical protein
MLKTHIIFEKNKFTWEVLFINHTEDYYTPLCVCKDYDDARYICDALNAKMEVE